MYDQEEHYIPSHHRLPEIAPAAFCRPALTSLHRQKLYSRQVKNWGQFNRKKWLEITDTIKKLKKWVVLTCHRIKMESQAVIQAKTQAKKNLLKCHPEPFAHTSSCKIRCTLPGCRIWFSLPSRGSDWRNPPSEPDTVCFPQCSRARAHRLENIQ